MIKRIKKYYYLTSRTNFLFFCIGILTGLLAYFYIEDNYEKNLFTVLARDVRNSASDKSDSSLMLSSLHIVHNALQSRSTFFNNVKGIKAGIFQPLTVDLMTGQGACGSYSLVMARLLNELDIDVRIVQMKVGEVYAEHNIVEGKYKNNWIVLDPLYDLYFKRPDNNLASFADVRQNWEYYKSQLPQEYNQSYRYEGVRYTNWDKIPIVMPAIKKMLDWVIGEDKADTFCLRVYMLRKFNVFFLFTFVLELLVILYSFLRLRKKGKATAYDTEKEPASNISATKVIIVKPQPQTT